MGQSSIGAVGNPDSDTGHVPLISVGTELNAGSLWWETEPSLGRKAQQPQPVNHFIMMTWPQGSKSKMWHTPILLQIPSNTFIFNWILSQSITALQKQFRFIHCSTPTALVVINLFFIVKTIYLLKLFGLFHKRKGWEVPIAAGLIKQWTTVHTPLGTGELLRK